MADTQKPVEVPETTVAAPEAVAETKPAETTTAAVPETAPAATEAKATEAPAAEAATETAAEAPAATEAAAPAVEAKKEVVPIEEGQLEHKAAPASFPKNLLYSKQHFWFGSEPIASDKLLATFKAEKATEVAHHVAAWASHTGKGLLFYGKDTSAPHGAIQLAEAEEPKVDGTNKFSVTSKGHKHTFKAATAADRDNWVSQLKLKIVEAKELAASVTETETYKSTLESLKPKPIVAPKKEEPKKEEAPAATEAVAAAAATEAPKEEEAKEVAKEEKKTEEPKRRSASRKRASIFGNLGFGKKEEVKKEETPAATTEAAAAEAAPAETVAAAEAPAVEAAPVVEAPAVEAAKEEEKPVEAAKEAKKEEKPVVSKRNSIFSNLSFGKKKAETEAAAPATPAKDVAAPADEVAPVAETAPVIPAVETTEPLSAEVASPTAVPAETTEVAAAPATNGESKKEVKSDKRKSSLPPFFSKIRQTVKGKSSKPAEKVEEKAAEDKPAETSEAAAAEPAAATEAAAELPKPVEEVPVVEETKPVAPPASAPVTAAA